MIPFQSTNPPPQPGGGHFLYFFAAGPAPKHQGSVGNAGAGQRRPLHPFAFFSANRRIIDLTRSFSLSP